MKNILFLLLVLAASPFAAQSETVVTAPESPYSFQPLEMYEFPAKDFSIAKYGARKNDVKATTAAFAKAMTACNKAGGGRVVVPAGEWKCGPIHFKSNCNLYLEEGAVVAFDDDLKLYLPPVQTAWEGMECMNFSPLVYAFECENIAITGSGKFAPKMDQWAKWYARPENHMKASAMLYAMASTDVPVHHRDMVEMNAEMRPQLINLNRCRNVQLADFHIYMSPFWTIHFFMCKDVWVHGIDNYAYGHNPDGLDLEMTQHALVEDCTFQQGDDAIVLKAGRNRDAWRLDMPTQDIVVRNCHTINGGAVLGVGSELSGGIKRVYVHDCKADYVHRVMNLKTNERRGGVIEDITVENVQTKYAEGVLRIATDVFFQWKDAVPTFVVKPTVIRNITVKNVRVDNVTYVVDIDGDPRVPVKNVTLENVHCGTVGDFATMFNNVEDLRMNNVGYDKLDHSAKPVRKVLDEYKAPRCAWFRKLQK